MNTKVLHDRTNSVGGEKHYDKMKDETFQSNLIYFQRFHQKTNDRKSMKKIFVLYFDMFE